MTHGALSTKEMRESVRLSMNIPWDHHQDLMWIAQARGVCMAKVVRDLIKEFLEGENERQSSADNS